MTLDTNRLTMRDENGDGALVISKPGFNANQLTKDDYDKLHFHSGWTEYGQILKAGQVTWRSADPFPGTSIEVETSCCRVDFDSPGYIPIVTFDYVETRNQFVNNATWPDQSGSQTVSINMSGWAFAEDWFKFNSGGNDPYAKFMRMGVFDGYFIVGVWDRFTYTGSDAYDLSVNYIVWSLPTDAITPYVKTGVQKPRLTFGKDPNGGVAMRLSRPGVNVKAATDDELLIGGTKKLPRLVKSVTVALTARQVATVSFEQLAQPCIAYIRTIRNNGTEDFVQEPYGLQGSGDGGVRYLPETDRVHILSLVDRTVICLIFTQGA